MLRNQRKGWIAPAVLAALLLAPGGWIVRLAAWLRLPPSVTAVWEMDSAHIDPLGQPKPTSSANIDPDG